MLFYRKIELLNQLNPINKIKMAFPKVVIILLSLLDSSFAEEIKFFDEVASTVKKTIHLNRELKTEHINQLESNSLRLEATYVA